MDDYEKLLDEAYEKMPAIVFETKRFEVPRARITTEGNKSIISNFKEVIDYIRRDPDHFLKFLGKDMGAAWRKENGRIILVGRFGTRLVNQKIEKYVKTYIICPVCNKPDTKLKKVDRILIMSCSACGAVSPVPQQ